MNTHTVEMNGKIIAVVHSAAPIIASAQDALDFLATIRYETNSERIALNQEALPNDFFILSTGLAGEVLQKFINYQTKLAVYGNFSRYTSKPLKDFIYESNRGENIFFVANAQEAAQKLSRAK